ncbi:diguanylate cyclase (GGDEF) domain-containing protein [Butyrivibrio proteoclasticus]|uniref:Diguanylate cyclase (GGDEF) domain-containing protein n=1 Tax=Butyrivibrio proteoclasticus TaxID=43305 RepID=A0A1I5XGR2_9FIRM|nr:GGDEF domain-containing protein [Butyrivibrio proteoclasticus]SFQ31149.1 diguanylate cyclase (GGDEF) domain-containing protein [Butyrivibrio proteoclasticus]
MSVITRVKTAFLSLLAIALIVLTVAVLGTSKFNTPNEFELIQLDSGWTISHGSEYHYIESLVNSYTGLANSGNIIVIRTTLPDLTSYSDIPICICFRSILSTVDVYVDDALVYTFGHDYVEKGKMIPKVYNFVPLPKNCSKKTLQIRFTAQENSAFSGFSPVYLGTYNDICNQLLEPKRLSVVVGIFLMMFGFILLIISPFMLMSSSKDTSIFFSATTSLAMGMYIFCFNDLFWIVSDNPALYTFLEYLSLFLIPPSIMGFVLFDGRDRNKKIVAYGFLGSLLFVLTVTLMHIFNIAHICNFVVLFHFTVLIQGVYMVITLTISLRKRLKEKSEFRGVALSTVFLVAGLLVFMICAQIDIIVFNILKYSAEGEQSASINFTTVGALLFMICLFLNYFYHRIEYLSESSVKEKLEGIAYTDALTGIANRARCELTLAKLDDDYTIISLDLDYLKYTNDNYGHTEGDHLLKGFAAILKESFTEALLIGRMGGDEFIVVLPYIDEERCERAIKCMVDLMCFRTSKEEHIRYSASWGYATNKELSFKAGATAQDVYLLADTKMYSMKKQHHNQSLGRLYDDLLKTFSQKGGNSNEI